MFVATYKTLDDDSAAFIHRNGEGGLYLGQRRQIREHAAPVVAVGRLDDDRQANVLRRLPGLLHVAHQSAFGHRHATSLQEALGQILVARYAFRNGTGTVGFRSEEHTSELQSLMRISYAVFCLKK